MNVKQRKRTLTFYRIRWRADFVLEIQTGIGNGVAKTALFGIRLRNDRIRKFRPEVERAVPCALSDVAARFPYARKPSVQGTARATQSMATASGFSHLLIVRHRQNKKQVPISKGDTFLLIGVANFSLVGLLSLYAAWRMAAKRTILHFSPFLFPQMAQIPADDGLRQHLRSLTKLTCSVNSVSELRVLCDPMYFCPFLALAASRPLPPKFSLLT